MTNVLIPAFNEQDTIGRSVDSVLSAGIQPVVIPNGCSDETARVARDHGAFVLEQEHAGKMPALQEGFRFLGERALAEPVLILDADSWPIFPKRWKETMERNVASTEEMMPCIAVGQLVFRHGVGLASNSLRTGLRYARNVRSVIQSSEGSWPGANTALRIYTQTQLDALLEIPHYWPGEDLAIKDAVVEMGGVAIKLLSPYTAVFADSRFQRNFFEQLRDTRQERMRKSIEQYEQRGAPGSIPNQQLEAYRQLRERT